jgi:hypothetical protein
MVYTYRPMLKTKAGEAMALGYLTNSRKAKIFPIFQVGESPPPTFAARMATTWAGRGAALDGSFNFNFTGSTAHFNAVFAALAANGIPVIPSLAINSPQAYLSSVLAKVGQHGPGLVLRTNLVSLPNAVAYAAANGWNAGSIDLLVEVGHIGEFNPATLAVYVGAAINTQIVPGVWRSVTLSAASAPKDFGGLPYGVSVVPRQEWILWNTLAQPPGQPVDFSDFGVSHLDLSEPPGFAMAKATVSVRYTAANHWIMIKGFATTGQNGLPMGAQYRAHAQTLIPRPDFNGIPPCWADDRIGAIASGASSAGGRAQWVEINTNRHLSLVAETLP